MTDNDCIIVPTVRIKEAMYCAECDVLYNFSDSPKGCPRCDNRCAHAMVWGKQITTTKEENPHRINGKGRKYSIYHYAR